MITIVTQDCILLMILLHSAVQRHTIMARTMRHT